MLYNSLNYFLGYKMLTAQDLINSRNQSRKLKFNTIPTAVEIEAVVAKLNKQRDALLLMRRHHKLKGQKLYRNQREMESIESTLRYIRSGGVFMVEGKFLNTPHVKLPI